jgi:hypothetical protein
MVSRRSILRSGTVSIAALGFPYILRAAPIVLSTVKQRLGGGLYLFVNAGGAGTFGGVAWGVGEDENNGWSQATPKRTMQAAYEYGKASFDFNGNGMELHLCPSGTHYAPLSAVSQLEGYHIFNVIGDKSSPNSFIIEAQEYDAILSPNGTGVCVNAQDYAAVGLIGVAMIGDQRSGHGATSIGVAGRQHAIIDMDTLAFWGMGGTHIQLDGEVTASIFGTETIYGPANTHHHVSGNSRLTKSADCCINSALAFRYFLLAETNSEIINSSSNGYIGAGVGSVSSGYPYYAQLGGRILLGGHTPPGNVAGYCAPDSTVI